MKNIVFILSDDQGAWAARCARTKELYTPNIDALAESGARFDNFFCASPVCSPARASILTGLSPSCHGVLDWLRSGNLDEARYRAQGKENPYGGYADERKPIQYLSGLTAYTDLLADAGYTCALSGKWHLGDSVTPQHGFTDWFTLGKGGCYYDHPDIVENGEISVLHGQYVTDVITDRAVEDIQRYKDKPFYLSVHYTAPHSPWEWDQHPEKWIRRYDGCGFPSVPDVPDHPDLTMGRVYGTPQRNINLTGYFAAVSAMDEGVGHILQALEDEKLSEDTLVIFTSDNGMSMGHHGVWGKGNGTYPANMYESAIKVPFVVRMPGAQGGRVISDCVSAYDIFPTLLEYAGVPCPQDARRPGRSILPLISGQAQKKRDVVIYDEYGPVRMIRTERYKYVHRYPYGPHELFDLMNDPGEDHNLVDDPAHTEVVRELRARLEAWFERYADPARDGLREAVTGAGQMCRVGVSAERTDRFAPHYPLAREQAKG